MTDGVQIDRFVERAALERQELAVATGIFVPQARTASRAKAAIEHAAAVGRPGPEARRPGNQLEIRASDPDRDAERRSGLLAALKAMAEASAHRRRGDLET